MRGSMVLSSAVVGCRPFDSAGRRFVTAGRRLSQRGSLPCLSGRYSTQRGESMTEREQMLDELRPVSFAIAYRMLGSVSEAEDGVQEALLRVHRTLEDGDEILAPRAFVATIPT